jgi:hypothetical protein
MGKEFPAGARIFKYKLDFYYQQALLYLVTLVLYAGIRGTFEFERLPSMVSDPILYIIILFVIISFVVLLLNRARERKLVIAHDRRIFHNKYRDREVLFSDIEWFHIGRERTVRTAGRSQMIVFKMKQRRRLFRIRLGRYERERELLNEMQRLGEQLPRGKRSSIRMD